MAISNISGRDVLSATISHLGAGSCIGWELNYFHGFPKFLDANK
jgi:hypothetical protein